MMIAPNSVVRQKDEAQGEEKEETEVKEREDKQDLRPQARMLPQVQIGQGYWMRETRENKDGGVGFYSTG